MIIYNKALDNIVRLAHHPCTYKIPWYKDNNFLQPIHFFKSLAMRFEQITLVHYQAISHTDNKNLQFFLDLKSYVK